MERWIRDRLLEKAKSISIFYKEIAEQGLTEEKQQILNRLLSEEEMVYSLIPLEDYPKYIAFFSPKFKYLTKETPSFMFLEYQYIPEVRILHKLYFYQEKRSMFVDVCLSNEKEKRWQYVHDKEFYFHLMKLYSFYVQVAKENEQVLNESYVNVVYHFAYAEEYYIKGLLSYNKEIIQKLSGIRDFDEMEEEDASIIQFTYEYLISQGDTFLKDNPFVALCYKMYLEAYYCSIDDKGLIDELFNLYSKESIPDLSPILRTFFDEMQYFVENVKSLKIKL